MIEIIGTVLEYYILKDSTNATHALVKQDNPLEFIPADYGKSVVLNNMHKIEYTPSECVMDGFDGPEDLRYLDYVQQFHLNKFDLTQQ